MTRYLLDTGPLTALLLERTGATSLIRPWLLNRAVATSALAVGETAEHFLGRFDAESRVHALIALTDAFPVLPVTVPIGIRYAVLRRLLRPPRGAGLIGDVDTVIAATAQEHGLTIVTTDSDFIRIPDVDVLLLDRRTFEPIDNVGAGNRRP